MRIIRRLVVTVAVLAGLAALANVALAGVAERKAADQVRASMKLSSTPTVRLDAFPILLRLVQGRIPHASIDASDVTVRGLTVARFHLGVDDLRMSLGDLTAGRGKLRVGGGDAYGEVSEDAANAYLERQRQDVRVRFLGDEARVRTRATYGGRAHDIEAAGRLSLAGNDLVFVPSIVTVDGGPPPREIAARARRDASFRVPLPALPGGIRPRRVSVHDGVARLDVEFGRTTIDLGSL